MKLLLQKFRLFYIECLQIFRGPSSEDSTICCHVSPYKTVAQKTLTQSFLKCIWLSKENAYIHWTKIETEREKFAVAFMNGFDIPRGGIDAHGDPMETIAAYLCSSESSSMLWKNFVQIEK